MISKSYWLGFFHSFAILIICKGAYNYYNQRPIEAVHNPTPEELDAKAKGCTEAIAIIDSDLNYLVDLSTRIDYAGRRNWIWQSTANSFNKELRSHARKLQEKREELTGRPW